MLDGIGPDMTIVDGSEATYKARTPEDDEYVWCYHE